MDSDKLLKALNNHDNESILHFTTRQITTNNLSILKQLHLSKEDTLEILSKLNGYKYVDEMNELKYGTHVRWVPMKDGHLITLTRGALFCETKITDNGVFLVCKNYGYKPVFFQISLDHNLIFQKLTEQEKIILFAMDHIST
tara:strand:+ start:6308 stop:6733 length:426 start_codon:yes stop_codon:yes gene_type:complete